MARSLSDTARRRMLDAALAILLSEGVHSVTADEVARRSGVAKTTLYRHFGSTDALVFAVVEDSVAVAPQPNTGSLRGDLEAIHRRYIEVASVHQTRELFAWMISKSMESPENKELFRHARMSPRGPTVVALQRAIARGEVDAAIDLDLAMHMIQGPLIAKRIIDNTDITPADLEHLLDMTMLALQPKGNP